MLTFKICIYVWDTLKRLEEQILLVLTQVLLVAHFHLWPQNKRQNKNQQENRNTAKNAEVIVIYFGSFIGSGWDSTATFSVSDVGASKRGISASVLFFNNASHLHKATPTPLLRYRYRLYALPFLCTARFIRILIYFLSYFLAFIHFYVPVRTA